MTDIPARLVAGYAMQTVEDFDLVPDGTKVRVVSDHSEWYEKREGMWYSANGDRYTGGWGLNGHNEIWVLGGPAADRPQETLQQYKWRYRDIALHGVAQHSVSYHSSIETIRDLGCGGENPFEAFPPGRGMKVRNLYDQRQLPDNTVIVVGDPSTTEYGVFCKVSGRWAHLFGSNTRIDRGGSPTIELFGGQLIEQEWINTVGTDEDRRNIIGFKKAAYQAGIELKNEQDWCGTYEQVISAVGIDRSVMKVSEIDGVVLGDWVGPAVAQGLPVGTVLRWSHTDRPNDDYAYFMRVDWSTNRAGTAKIFGRRADGSNDNDGYKRRMQVVGFPDDSREPMSIEHPNIQRDWDLLPAGTWLRVGEQDYTMCEDHRTRNYSPYSGESNRVGQYNYNQYGHNPVFRIAGFPTPTQPAASIPVLAV